MSETVTPDARCLIGGPATGKTSSLISRARTLAESTDGRILFMCANHVSALHVREELSDLSGHIEVNTPLEMALSVVRDARSTNHLHLLDPWEHRVFFEDMKCSGIKPRRLRELLSFLERGWSDLADEDPRWVQTTEEQDVISLAQRHLAFIDGLLPAEASHHAAHALRASASLLNRHAREHVIADDWTCMSRASQTMLRLMARRTITIAGDNALPPRVGEPYPFAGGLAAFQKAFPHADVEILETCHIPARIASLLNALRTDEALGGGRVHPSAGKVDQADSLSVNMGETMLDECRAIANAVALARGSENRIGDIMVVGINRAWRSNVARYLSAQGYAVTRVDTQGGGRTASKEQALERIAHDKDDSVAWRTLCGLKGDLALSAPIAAIRTVAEPHGLTLSQALAQLNEGTLDGADYSDKRIEILLRIYRGSLGEIEAIRAESGRSGIAMSEYQQGPNGCGSSPERRASFLEGHSSSPEGNNSSLKECGVSLELCDVLVGEPVDAFGRQLDTIIFGGFVNGIIPSRAMCEPGVLVGNARKHAHRLDASNVHLCAGSARNRLVFTGFRSCSLETAERLKLHIARIRLQDGMRVCTIEPSILLSEFVYPSGSNTPDASSF